MSVLRAAGLASQILGNVTAQEIGWLAYCMQRGNGAYRPPDSPEIHVVLYSPLLVNSPKPPPYPPLIRTVIGHRLKSKRIHTTAGVADMFRSRCRNLGTGHLPGSMSTWAPAAKRSLAIKPIGGVDRRTYRVATPDSAMPDNEYYWYDLGPTEQYPLGCVVYRVSSDRLLTAFTRIGPDTWVRFDTGPMADDTEATRLIQQSEVHAWTDDPRLVPPPPIFTLP
ncbi:MAG TPA: hypothetical protein VLA88_04930 [Candidatus Saccharimonadales bacterium]|nr:hypothetical protein [Candidatus Saccharimonadales bacterium]